MIQGQRKTSLTPETILNKLSEYDIFMQFMPDRNWRINEATISPFPHNGHIETNPSFIIGNRQGYLSFHDFALGISGDCFSFVKEIEHLLSMDDVLKKIDESFGLGISSNKNVGRYKTITKEYKQPEIELGKRYCIIQCMTRKFTKEELQYWDDYHLDISDLQKNHVYALSKVYINRQLFPIKESELKFGYLFENSWKLYFPEKKKKGKWISSVPIDTAYGLENLDKDHNGLILDSLKDLMVCCKIYEYCAGTQNETRRALSDESIKYINENTKQTFLGFDADAPGKSASFLITDELGWRHINTPDRLLPDVKDWAAWSKLEGLGALENHFKLKGLYESS